MKKLFTLKPSLPMGENKLIKRGFVGNVGKSTRFVTDGHLMFQRSDVVDSLSGKLKRTRMDCGTPSEESMAKVWQQVLRRKQIAAKFIGCGDSFLAEIAFLRSTTKRLVIVDAHKMALLVRVTGATTAAFCTGKNPREKPIAFFRKGKMVGLLMGMRTGIELAEEYHCNGPAMPFFRKSGGTQ